MLEGLILEGGYFKKVMETLKDICCDINLECDDSGIKIQAMDVSHVALVLLKLQDTFFKHYRCDSYCSIGLNLSHFLKLLSCVKDDNSITLIYDNSLNDPVLRILINDIDEKSKQNLMI